MSTLSIVRVGLVVVVLGGAVGLPACTGMELHGTAFRAACARYTDEGCPCRQSNECTTLWCANGECARRE